VAAADDLAAVVVCSGDFIVEKRAAVEQGG